MLSILERAKASLREDYFRECDDIIAANFPSDTAWKSRREAVRNFAHTLDLDARDKIECEVINLFRFKQTPENFERAQNQIFLAWEKFCDVKLECEALCSFFPKTPFVGEGDWTLHFG